MSASSSTSLATRIERLALACMALGVALMLQPWWTGGLRAGFFATLGAVAAQIACSHAARRSSRERA